jgi:hypothetical protein
MSRLPQLRRGCIIEARIECEGELDSLVAFQRTEFDPHHSLGRQALAERGAAFVQPAGGEHGDVLLRVARSTDQVVTERKRELVEPLQVVHDE